MAASNLQLGALNNEAKLIWRNFLSNLFKNWNLLRGHSELNQGPAGLQPDALPLSYIPHLWAISKPYEQIVWNASTQDHLPLVYKTFVNKSATMSTKKIMRPLHGGYKTCYGNSKAVRFDSRMLTFFCSKEGFLKFVFFSQSGNHKLLILSKTGLVRDLNPGPRAPEARIIPLDQRATSSLIIGRICDSYIP